MIILCMVRYHSDAFADYKGKVFGCVLIEYNSIDRKHASAILWYLSQVYWKCYSHPYNPLLGFKRSVSLPLFGSRGTPDRTLRRCVVGKQFQQ